MDISLPILTIGETECKISDNRRTQGSIMDWKQMIAELRGRGWTQQQIALHVGSSQASVSDLGSGKTLNPTYALGKGIEDLHRSGEMPPDVLREQTSAAEGGL